MAAVTTLVVLTSALAAPGGAGAHAVAAARAQAVAERLVGTYVDSLHGLSIVGSVERVATGSCVARRPSEDHVHLRTCPYIIRLTLADAARMRCAGTVDVRVRSAASGRLVGTLQSPACTFRR